MALGIAIPIPKRNTLFQEVPVKVVNATKDPSPLLIGYPMGGTNDTKQYDPDNMILCPRLLRALGRSGAGSFPFCDNCLAGLGLGNCGVVDEINTILKAGNNTRTN